VAGGSQQAGSIESISLCDAAWINYVSADGSPPD
jgi:hypothetical protein